jgi:hypothetical protein
VCVTWSDSVRQMAGVGTCGVAYGETLNSCSCNDRSVLKDKSYAPPCVIRSSSPPPPSGPAPCKDATCKLHRHSLGASRWC